MPLVALALVVLLQGCTTIETLGRDRRDAPWDPKPGQGQLMDQIPNNEGSANAICCGHLRECKPHQSPRC